MKLLQCERGAVDVHAVHKIAERFPTPYEFRPPFFRDGLLVLVAYLLYPIVVVIFGFFYIFYGSILYIFGPIVIALMPLGGANRLAKSYIENIFIWNAWPILYGGFGALLSAVQMGQIGQMLNQNNFLGGLGNLEEQHLASRSQHPVVFAKCLVEVSHVPQRITHRQKIK